ncbi:MAG: hypothetical protein K6E32_10005 [Lachnospiraceae bacterium]|nr:hypothetical protein [Lachnospiraceae bacterium]
MKKFAKYLIKAALVLFAAGGILGFLGFAGAAFAHGGIVNGTDSINKDIDEELKNFSYHFDNLYVSRNGIIFAGARSDIIQSVDKNYRFSADQVSNVALRFGQGEFFVVTDPSARGISVLVEGRIRYECSVKDKTLSLWPSEEVLNIGFPDNYSRVTVVFPEGFRPRREVLSVEAGSLYVGSVEADTLVLNTEAGVINIEGGVSSDEVIASVSAGSIYCYHFNTEKLEANVNAGEFVSGVSDKMYSADVNINVGKVYILTGSPDYALNSNMKFLASTRYRLNGHNRQNSGAAGEINVNCNLGSFVLECE